MNTVLESKAKVAGAKAAEEGNASKSEKKQQSKFEKKLSKIRKTPMKGKNRMGKNKFKKLKRMLEKSEIL